MTRYFFYKASIRPDDCQYYDYSAGVAGYLTQQARNKFILYGTMDQLDEWLGSMKPGNRLNRR